MTTSSIEVVDLARWYFLPWRHLPLSKMRQKIRPNVSNPRASSTKQPTVVKIYFGWTHFNESQKRYQQVRQRKVTGAGKGTAESASIPIDMLRTSSYDELLEAAKAEFFCDGKSKFGECSEMDFPLAMFSGNIIDRDEFSFRNFISKGTKCRMYLASKKVRTNFIEIKTACVCLCWYMCFFNLNVLKILFIKRNRLKWFLFCWKWCSLIWGSDI